MKYFLGIVFYIVFPAGVFGKTLSTDLFSLDKPDAVLFQEFQNKFNQNFAKTAEKIDRFNVFSQNLVKIRALNALNTSAQFGINAFSALTPEEFQQRLLSDEFMVPSKVQNATDKDVNDPGHWWQHEHRRATRDVYPANFDWRTQNVISPIQDQGSCGSCWAFADVAAVEAHYAIKYNGAKIELSEQEMVDCETRSHGCNGGYTYDALYYIQDKGLHSRTNYPYEGYTNGHGCLANNISGTKTKIADAHYILPNTEEEVKKFVYNKGPAIMGFVLPYSIQYYVSGIFSISWEQCRAERNGNHAMLVIGYGEENGKKFWTAKNSWGKWWGENGFIRFERDVAFCGIVSNYYLFAPSFDPPTTTTSTTTTTTPVPTTTTTVPTTTTLAPGFAPLNCSGAMDLVIVIDVSASMNENRLEIVKSQLFNSIGQNGIRWESMDNNTARIGIILSGSLEIDRTSSPHRYIDFKGDITDIYASTKIITFTPHFKQAIRSIPSMLGDNDIGLCMNLSLNGDYSSSNWYFGEKLFGNEGDRPNVPNSMIVITAGADTSNVAFATNQLRNAGVRVYSIGFEDISLAQLQEISGDPATAFSTTPENLANTIKQICTPVPTTTTAVPATATTTTVSTTTVPTITSVPTTTTTVIPTTTAKPVSFPRLNCSGAMDLVIVIDVSASMNENRLEIVKSQLYNSIGQNGIRWESYDNNTARIGIILSGSLEIDRTSSPHRYIDFKGDITDIYASTKIITFTPHFKQAIRSIPSMLGDNDIGLCMNLSLNGDYSSSNWYFGEKLFGNEGDRPNVPNSMIVITAAADTSNVATATTQLRNAGVQVYSIGFEDITLAQLQEISGDPATAFSTTPENLANTIKQICTGA